MGTNNLHKRKAEDAPQPAPGSGRYLRRRTSVTSATSGRRENTAGVSRRTPATRARLPCTPSSIANVAQDLSTEIVENVAAQSGEQEPLGTPTEVTRTSLTGYPNFLIDRRSATVYTPVGPSEQLPSDVADFVLRQATNRRAASWLTSAFAMVPTPSRASSSGPGANILRTDAATQTTAHQAPTSLQTVSSAAGLCSPSADGADARTNDVDPQTNTPHATPHNSVSDVAEHMANALAHIAATLNHKLGQAHQHEASARGLREETAALEKSMQDLQACMPLMRQWADFQTGGHDSA